MRRDTRLTSRAERRNRKNVLLIKKPCFLSNINDSMKGFTHNSGYAEFITGAQLHRIVINNFSQLSQPHPFSLLIHNTGSHICLCVCLSLFLTDTHTHAHKVFLFRNTVYVRVHVHVRCSAAALTYFSLFPLTSCESPAAEEILYSCTFIFYVKTQA